ncbi:16568_t:CDS:2, partial [Gigaspora margarita]
MADPGNANTLRRGEPYSFPFPTPNITAFEESSEPASFAGGPIRHRKKRNHTNTPYTRVASSPNPNPQETHWLLNIVKKYIPQWLRDILWRTAVPTIPNTEDTAMEMTSPENETIAENIVQSSIEELNNAMVKREEQHQPSQLDTITKMNLKNKYNRSSSKIAARFGRRMYSNPLHRRGNIIPRKRGNYVSAREEDLLYPDEINESLSDKEQLPEIPSDWYKPFKNLAVNDSFSTSSSGTSTPSQEPDINKKSLSQGPPLKKFKSDLVPDINWFNYHPSEKKATIPSSSTSKNQNISSADNLLKVPTVNSMVPASKSDVSETNNDVEEFSTTPLTQPRFIQIIDQMKNEQYYSETKKKIDFSASISTNTVFTSTPPISKGTLSVSTPTQTNSNLAINTSVKSVTGFGSKTPDLFSLPPKPLTSVFSAPVISKDQQEQPSKALVADSTDVEERGSVDQNVDKPEEKQEETSNATELTVVNIEIEKAEIEKTELIEVQPEPEPEPYTIISVEESKDEKNNKEERESKEEKENKDENKENKDEKDQKIVEIQRENENNDENKKIQGIEEKKESEEVKDEQVNDKNKVFGGFYSSTSQAPTLASSPSTSQAPTLASSPSTSQAPTLASSPSTSQAPILASSPPSGKLGNAFFPVDNSSTEVTSSNMPKYTKSSSFRGKNRRPGYKTGSNNLLPKTGSFDGSDTSRMMIPAESTFDFKMEKDTSIIPSIQPISTSSPFKFNQESTPAEPMFTTNGTTSSTFNFSSSFSSQPLPTPVTFGNGFGLSLNLPETPTTTFSTINNSPNNFMSINGDTQIFQNGTGVQKNLQSTNIGDR